jgi:hypothetical protein
MKEEMGPGTDKIISTARAECGVGGNQPSANYSSSTDLRLSHLESSLFLPATQFSIPAVIYNMTTPVPAKRQQREEYRRKIQEQAERGGDGDLSSVKMPQKRFFRQRAHANPFSDHNLD